jgi:hypothetical protein
MLKLEFAHIHTYIHTYIHTQYSLRRDAKKPFFPIINTAVKRPENYEAELTTLYTTNAETAQMIHDCILFRAKICYAMQCAQDEKGSGRGRCRFVYMRVCVCVCVRVCVCVCYTCMYVYVCARAQYQKGRCRFVFMYVLLCVYVRYTFMYVCMCTR